MHRWRRPYRPGFAIWLVAAGLPFAATVAVIAMADVLRRGPVWMLAVAGPLSLCALAYAVRSSMLGVYVSDEGVMSRNLTGSRRVEWRSVVGFRSATPRTGGQELARQVIHIDLVGGESLQTAILRGGNFDQFHRKATFGRARYWPERYDEILALLREELATRRGGRP